MVPGVVPPSWVAINPNPKPPIEGQPPVPTRRPIRSAVAITAGLKEGDRVILEGIQKVRPGRTGRTRNVEHDPARGCECDHEEVMSRRKRRNKLQRRKPTAFGISPPKMNSTQAHA